MIKRLLKNAVSNVGLLIVKMIITFVMSPVIVSSLGNYDYGIWEVVFCVVGYMGLLDVGLPTAIVRYVAKYQAVKDRDSLNKLYSSALVFMGAIGFFLFLVFVGWVIFFPDAFLQEGDHSHKYVLFLLVVGAQLFITFPGYVFQSMHQGCQRYTVLNIITVVNSILGAFVAYWLLKNGHGIVGLIVVNASGVALKFTLYWNLLRFEKFGGFRFRAGDVSFNKIRMLYSFGFKSLMIGLSFQLSRSIGPMAIAVFLSPAIVTFYVIPVALVRHAVNLIATITAVFMPEFSGLNATREYGKITSLYLMASRLVVSLMVPIVIGILFLGRAFISRWMGPDYAENGRYIIYIVSVAYTFGYLNPFSNRFLTALGKQEILAKIRFISALVNLAICLALVHIFNKEGVAVAALIPALIFEPVILYAVCCQLGITVKKYVGSVILPILPSAGAITGFLWWCVGRFECTTYSELVLITLVAATIYLSLFFVTGLEKSEKIFLLSQVKSV